MQRFVGVASPVAGPSHRSYRIPPETASESLDPARRSPAGAITSKPCATLPMRPVMPNQLASRNADASWTLLRAVLEDPLVGLGRTPWRSVAGFCPYG